MGERAASGSRRRSRAALARKEAQDRAARFLEREQRLVDLATDFARADEEIEAARARQLVTVHVMVDELKVSRVEVSERLGISESEVRSVLTRYQKTRCDREGDDAGSQQVGTGVGGDGVGYSE